MRYDDELRLAMQRDSLVNMAMKQGKVLGETREETLARLVVILTEIKDEAYQERIQQLLMSTRPLHFKRDLD